MASASVLQPYAPSKFDALPEFEAALEARPLIEQAAAAARELFTAHGLAETCGLAMLHKHFPLKADEVLVEEAVGEKSLIEPRPAATLETGELLPYMFQLEEGAGGCFSLAPLEFAPRGIVNASNLTALLENVRFINELGALARKFGGLSFVGVTLLHRDHVAVVDGSTVEFTNHESRVLSIVPATRAAGYTACTDKHVITTTRTVWTFGTQKGEDKCSHCVHCYHR